MTNWKTCNLEDINFIFTNKEEGKRLITQHDSYIDNLTQQDLECRCHKREATLEDYLNLCKEAVLEFSEEEEAQATFILCEIDSELKRRGMAIPYLETINLVKTTGEDENDAYGYTRGNTIFINQNVFENDATLEHLLVHELFHLLTRINPSFKKALYDIIGFKIEDKFFKFPKSKHIHFVSNPDACNQVCYANFNVYGHDVNTIVLAGSTERYHGGKFGNYCQPLYLLLDEKKDFIRNKSGELVRLGKFDGIGPYLEHIGRNTDYIFNPEEALAENFVIAVLGTLEDLPNPEIIDSIRKTMQSAA